jgi:tetratricopeptide (TPR) repeat protein
LVRELGAGNMGAVFEAVDLLSGQYIALKQVRIPPEQLEYGSRSDSGDATMALAQEFKILASLRHPHIISVLDYGFDVIGGKREPYITMELLQDAESLLEQGERLDHDGKVVLLVQMLQALAYLHRRGILHRDLKPKNVMVVDEQVKVLDFGLSIPGEQAKEGEVAGTPSYMAPELWVGGAASKQSDLYAVGVMAYRLFAGFPPFDISNLRVLFTQVRNKTPDFTVLQTDDEIRAIVMRLMAKEPADRYDDAGEVTAALLSAIGRPTKVETAATRESFLQAATFVGRDTQLQLLTDIFQRAARGRGSALLISGESGVGKSRLLEELRTRALVEGALVLRGQAVNEVNAPYTVWRGVLRWLALLGHLDERQAAILKPLVPDISKLMGRDIPDAPEVTPQAAQARLVRLIELLFRAQTLDVGQPILVMLEDLHWADGESMNMLAHLSRYVTGLPLLIVGSYRDDETPDLPYLLPDMEIVRLSRLKPDQTAELTQAILGSAGRNPELLDLLQRETEGNTFFLVEMVRALAEEAGQLSAVGNAPLPMSLLTGGVQGIVQRRLNRVPEGARPLLELAAVGGRQLDLTVIRHILREDDGAAYLEGWLNDCADAAVLEVQDGQWRFAHNKLRDGVLYQLDSDTLQRLSRRFALAVETVYEYSHKQNAELLAHYWRNAGDAAKEEQYAALAGEQALRNGAYQAAQGYLQRALDLQGSIETTKRKQAQLTQFLGDTYAELEQEEKAETLYKQSLELCRETGYRWGVASSLNRLGNVAAQTGDFEGAAAYLLDALKTAMEARAQTVALASLVGMATLLARTGKREIAAEYTSFAINHLSCDGQTHYLGERLIAQLQSELPAETLDAALERGKSLELKEVASRILA